ncbi:hypothetical protein PVAP13_9KG141985 [Panicum virgatum]|uniref:Pentatricopeptide repeat-containing protein n=1 Tax=Panicum virgatum TaxID=38727 RepID=A0A8T0NFK7_PANVG|nr:hypothetical protein PVAP13_9KG141985 [Panicum virgatum]
MKAEKPSLIASLERTICDRARSRSLGPRDALRLSDKLLRQPRPRPGSPTAFDHLLAAAARGNDDGVARAVSLFGRMAGSGAPVPDACTYSILIACCCRTGRVDLAFSPLTSALKAGLRLTAKSFTPLLGGLCRERRVAEAVDVARHMMPELGCAPNAFSHSTVLKGLCDDGRSLEALELLRTLVRNRDEIDVVAYTIVIRGLFKEDKVEEAVKLFDEMRNQGISPNVITYLSIIDKLCKVGSVDKGQGDCSVYTSLINGHAISGQWKGAVMMFKEMIGKGIKPHHRKCSEARKVFDYLIKSGEKTDVTTYGILLHGLLFAYAVHGNADEAMLVLTDMREHVFSLNVVHYGTIINVLCKTGRMEDAMSQFNQMIHEGGFCICGNWKKAKELIFDMIHRGVHPEAKRFTLVILNLCREGRLEEFQKLFDLFISVDGYCLSRKVEKATALFDAFVSRGFKPNSVIYGSLINGYCKSGRIDDALTLFREMLSKEIKPTVITYGIILDGLFKAGGLCKNNFAGQALIIFQELLSMNFHLEILTYYIMIDGLLCAGKRKEAKDVFAAISTNEDGLLEEADELFLSMENNGHAADSREVLKAGTYLLKIDEKNLSLYSSTTQALISLFSDGKHEEQKKLLPEKYHYFSED